MDVSQLSYRATMAGLPEGKPPQARVKLFSIIMYVCVVFMLLYSGRKIAGNENIYYTVGKADRNGRMQAAVAADHHDRMMFDDVPKGMMIYTQWLCCLWCCMRKLKEHFRAQTWPGNANDALAGRKRWEDESGEDVAGSLHKGWPVYGFYPEPSKSIRGS